MLPNRLVLIAGTSCQSMDSIGMYNASRLTGTTTCMQ